MAALFETKTLGRTARKALQQVLGGSNGLAELTEAAKAAQDSRSLKALRFANCQKDHGPSFDLRISPVAPPHNR